MNFVESLPIITGKMPFASGSKVPMWPILVFPNDKIFLFFDQFDYLKCQHVYLKVLLH